MTAAVNDSVNDSVTPGRLTVITGPSGVGKGTLVALLRQRHPQIWLSVSATTRGPRAGEVDGEHYFFLERPAFERQVAEGGFLEWAEFAGHLYGTPRPPVEAHLAEGRPVLLEIELEGARQVRRSFPLPRHRRIVASRPAAVEACMLLAALEVSGAQAYPRRVLAGTAIIACSLANPASDQRRAGH